MSPAMLESYVLAVLALASGLCHTATAGYGFDSALPRIPQGSKAELREPGRTVLGEAVVDGSFQFLDVPIHYRMQDKPDPVLGVVLLLHGKRFSSAEWVGQGTLELLGSLGLRAIAIDLPGYGKSPALPYNDNNMRAELIKAAFEHAERGTNVTKILVSPSMSGKYALPFMDRYGPLLTGWAAVAPVGIHSWGGPWETTHRQVHMLALYGENDPMLPDADLLMKMFVLARKEVITGAGHATYMDSAPEFNRHLAAFIRKCLTK